MRRPLFILGSVESAVLVEKKIELAAGFSSGSTLEVKRHFPGSTFPEKLVYENGVYRTASDDNVLIIIANTGKAFGEKKKEGEVYFAFLPG